MEISIQSVHFSASEQLETFIQKKVSKLEHFFDGIIRAEISLKVIKPESANNKEVHIRLSVPGDDLFADKTSDTFEQAVDEVVQALEKQVQKFKEKLKGK
ncbi:MAG: ribosome-associated translation inhibitor RaiA [Bacteroidales bacterium]|jgi:putative sigma-54 modulation protein|nr:ribosome-associated translation inhibitor RaiA [Bacteroidales bacterium]